MKLIFIFKLLLSVVVYLKADEDVDVSFFGFDDFDEFESMNLNVDPCEDFFEYTCGNFKNLHQLQDGDGAIDQFSILEEKLALAVHGILNEEVKMSDPVALQKAKSAYHACVGEDFLDVLGMVDPEVEIIKKYGGFPIVGPEVTNSFDEFHSDPEYEEFGWNTIADIAAEFGISIFFTPSLYADTLNATRNLLRISSDGVDNPSQFRPVHSPSYEEAIEEGFKAMLDQSETVSTRLVNIQTTTISPMEVLLRNLSLKIKRSLGSHVDDEYLFEKVSNISSFLVGIYNQGYIPDDAEIGPINDDPTAITATLRQLNEWTQKHFGDTVQLDWVEYVKRLLQYTHVEVNEDFLVLVPLQLNVTLYGIINLVRLTDEDVVKSAALLRAFIYTAADSDSETRSYFEDYLKAIDNPVYPRWEYCTRKIMDATGTIALGLAVAYEYQLRYFNDSKLENAQSLIDNIQSSFKEVIAEAAWMDETSKAAAQVKADNIVSLLGFPDFVKDRRRLDRFYKNLEITTWDHFSNAKRIRAFQQAYTLNMLSQRDRKSWEQSPFNVNAYYNRQNNRIVFPLAIAHPIFFHGSASLLDYSRIGMIIAHEITHGFDSQGYLYNQNGILEPWWTSETRERFINNTQCFDEQYSNYVIDQINASISGASTLNENIADNGGLRNAYRAFKKVTALKDPTLITQFTDDQLFFIGYGTMWCSVESDDYLIALQQTCANSSSCHATARMRVNGVVSNMEEFAEAFQCPVGSPLNPETRCRIW